MSWKKFFMGERVPDKDDPNYKERYERSYAAGRKFADRIGLTWLSCHLQHWGSENRKTFLTVVFGFVILLFFLNAARVIVAYQQYTQQSQQTAVERVDSALYKSNRIIHN